MKYPHEYVYLTQSEIEAFTELLAEDGRKLNYDMHNRSKRIYRFTLNAETGLEGELTLTGITIRAADGAKCYSPHPDEDVLIRVPVSWASAWHLYGAGSRGMETYKEMRELHNLLTGVEE